MSGSLESIPWNVCVRRLDLGLYSHPKKLLGTGVRSHVNSKGKIPSTRGLNPQHCIMQDSEPDTLLTELFWSRNCLMMFAASFANTANVDMSKYLLH